MDSIKVHVMTEIVVIGPRDLAPSEFYFIDTTSKSVTGSKFLSPFFLGPVEIPITGEIARNVENGWQFTKLYEEHTDNEGNPTDEYWQWREDGLTETWAQRYPMGKGKKPLCSLLENRRLDYVEARREIYVEIYKQGLLNSDCWKSFVDYVATRDKVALWDFDGYLTEDDFETVLSNPNKKMGHAFVVKALLEEELK